MTEPRRVLYLGPKHPDDITDVPGIDFRPALTVPAESFSHPGVTVTVVDRQTGEDVTSTLFVSGSVGVSNNHVNFRLQGGSDNHEYVARVRVTTSSARIENGFVYFAVTSRMRK